MAEAMADRRGSHGDPDPRKGTTRDDWKNVSRELDSKWRDLLGRPRVIRKSDVVAEGEGIYARFLDNEKLGLKTLRAAFVDLVPGSTGVRYGRMNEDVFYVLKGKGYDVHDGEKFEWEAGDVVIVPSGAVHCHINPDTKETAQTLTFIPKSFYTGSNLTADRLVHLADEIQRLD